MMMNLIPALSLLLFPSLLFVQAFGQGEQQMFRGDKLVEEEEEEWWRVPEPAGRCIDPPVPTPGLDSDLPPAPGCVLAPGEAERLHREHGEYPDEQLEYLGNQSSSDLLQESNNLTAEQEVTVRKWIHKQYDIRNELSHELVDETSWNALMLMMKLENTTLPPEERDRAEIALIEEMTGDQIEKFLEIEEVPIRLTVQYNDLKERGNVPAADIAPSNP